ncbi:MAG: hypothetical protein MZV70_19740 [Desulfobacterales bacterium]|nr:hypothetical protein [Desulfobacterales bacterium]
MEALLRFGPDTLNAARTACRWRLSRSHRRQFQGRSCAGGRRGSGKASLAAPTR